MDETTLSVEEQKERKIMKLLLKIKNGTPPMRKAAMRQVTINLSNYEAPDADPTWSRKLQYSKGWLSCLYLKPRPDPLNHHHQITDKAREFGAASLFNQILPLLMSPTLEDQERHLLVKVIDRWASDLVSENLFLFKAIWLQETTGFLLLFGILPYLDKGHDRWAWVTFRRGRLVQ